MAHGQPDFAATTPKSTVYGLSDMAELAARLGSIVTFDRRGDVVFSDDFESGISKWTKSVWGSSTVTHSSVYARSRGFSCKLYVPNLASNYSAILHYCPQMVQGKVGLEVSFNTPDEEAQIASYFSHYDGTNYTRFHVKYRTDTNILYYYNSAGNWVELASGINFFDSPVYFHTLKVVGDLVTNKYVRCIMDNNEYDLSSIAARVAASSVYPTAAIQITLSNLADLPNSVYIDDVIVTQNEP